ncbi:MAG: hypothetical protein JNM68_15230, partial [Dinghuibacter sp.]|nr:hypothetical protein [Dinghuibacter sp.]
FSHADMVVKGGDTISGAENIAFTDKDHYEVATCEETFVAMYRFFNNRAPADAPENKRPTGKKTVFPLSGKALTLGENKPLANARVQVYEVEQRSGKRTNKKNNAVFITGNKGDWGPFYCTPGIYYEFELVPADSSRTISYYMLPFEGPDHLVYLRGLPQKGMVAGMLNQLPNKPDQALVVIFSGKKALIHGRDTMAMNNIPLSSAAYNPASKTIISTFLFDDGDAQTSGKKIASLSMAPFIGGIDVYLPAGKNITHKVMVNGKTITLPGEPSAKKIMIAVF